MTANPTTPCATELCRLCNGKLAEQFTLRVLNKYDVVYSKCMHCNSLQTERPYWLGEAYQSNLTLLDTGVAQRNLANLAATYPVSRILRLRDLIDYGGGDGLLCRLLRDYGLNCFANDKYATASYSRGFCAPNFERPELLLAFEVIEHFENPLSDLDELFELNADAIFASTGIYSNQGSDWWYLTPETGQHVFFYSRQAFHLIAEKYGYEVVIHGNYALFLKANSTSRPKRLLLRMMLNKVAIRLSGAAIRLLPAKGVWADFYNLRRRKP